MRVIGIIAEFNPFHKGHEYLIERAREAVGDPRAIVMTVMSGPFVQRGTPSILPKNIRAKQALKSGADLVIEIPFTFACAPSERFAGGAVETLYRTGVVTDLAFGVDCEDPDLIRTLSEIKPDDETIRNCLSDGMNYPAARAEGMIAALKTQNPTAAAREDMIRETLRMPNSILALDYLRAVKDVGADSRFKIHMIPRKPGYSATSSREIYLGDRSIATLPDKLIDMIPTNALAVMLAGLSNKEYTFPDTDRYADDLISEAVKSDLSGYAYMTDGLDGYIKNTVSGMRTFSYEDLRSALQTKHFTMPRIMRAMSSALVGQSAKYVANEKHPRYIRVLGFNRDGRYCLKVMSKCARLPLIHNCSDAKELYASDPALKAQFELDINAGEVQGKYLGIPRGSQWSDCPIITK